MSYIKNVRVKYTSPEWSLRLLRFESSRFLS